MSDVAMVVEAISQGAKEIGEVVNTINAVGDAISTVKEVGSNLINGIKNGISGITNRIKGKKSSSSNSPIKTMSISEFLGKKKTTDIKPINTTVKTIVSPNTNTVQHNTTVKPFVSTSSSGSVTKETTVAKTTNKSTVSTSKNNDWRPVYNGYTNELKGV